MVVHQLLKSAASANEQNRDQFLALIERAKQREGVSPRVAMMDQIKEERPDRSAEPLSTEDAIMRMAQRQHDEAVKMKRRKAVSVLLPALLGGALGGTAGYSSEGTKSMGRQLYANNFSGVDGQQVKNDALKGGLIGVLGGGAVGAGLGAARLGVRNWLGLDPIADSAR